MAELDHHRYLWMRGFLVGENGCARALESIVVRRVNMGTGKVRQEMNDRNGTTGKDRQERIDREGTTGRHRQGRNDRTTPKGRERQDDTERGERQDDTERQDGTERIGHGGAVIH